MAVSHGVGTLVRNSTRLGVSRIGLFVWVLYEAFSGLPKLLHGDRFSRRRVVEALFQTALRPLPVVTLLAALAGLVSAFSAARALGVVHLEEPLLLALREALTREVMPLLVGIFVAGRSGVGLAVRIARMKGSGEIDSLRVIGLDPARYVLPPSLLAFLSAGAALMVWGTAIAHVTAALLLQYSEDIPAVRFAAVVLVPAASGDLWAGLLRVEVYALLSLAIAAAEGADAGRDSHALETAAHDSFVKSLLAIFGSAAVLSGAGL